ncbi:hypothetical protein MAH1_15910 [Sessilibacter sp. MAH1]
MDKNIDKTDSDPILTQSATNTEKDSIAVDNAAGKNKPDDSKNPSTNPPNQSLYSKYSPTFPVLGQAIDVSRHIPLSRNIALAPLFPAGVSYSQKNSHKEIAHISDRFSKMQNISGFGYWEWNFETNVFRVFPGQLWREMGYSLGDMGRIKSIDDAYEFVHPEDQEKISACAQRHFEFNAPYSESYRMRNRDGSYRWVQGQASSIRNRNNEVIYFAGVNYDITEEKRVEFALRESQIRFARILESSNDGVWEWSRKDRTINFSQGCWALLGFSIDDLEMGNNQTRKWLIRIHPQDRARVENEIYQKVKNAQAFDLEYRILNRTGQWQWIRTRGDVITNSQGEVEFLSGAHVDITEIKNSQERILAAKNMADKANRAKSEFLSSMSHELRTPMNAILGFTQLFDRDKNLTPDQAENIVEIKKAGKQLLRLINDVLEFSKIEAGKMLPQLRPTKLESVISEVVEQLRSLANKHSVKVSFTQDESNTTFVNADRNCLKQALIKLLTNAILYNSKNGSVAIYLTDMAPDYVTISVNDTGKGIPKKYHAQLFEPFAEFENRSSSPPGNGVGLAICKQLVELMDGRITFESSEDVGSSFKICLPVASNVVNETQLTGEFKATDFVNFDQNLFQSKKILYVDDDAKSRNSLTQYFSSFKDLTFIVAAEGIKGLFEARNTRPDIIFYDLHMPGVDGYEFIKIIRNDPNTRLIPIIALSEIVNKQQMRDVIEAGFNDVLSKPLDIEQLTVIALQLIN